MLRKILDPRKMHLASLALLSAMMLTLAACDDDAEDAVENVGDAVEETGEAAGDAVEEATD